MPLNLLVLLLYGVLQILLREYLIFVILVSLFLKRIHVNLVLVLVYEIDAVFQELVLGDKLLRARFFHPHLR